MKRRLFLKSGSVGVGGILVIPTLLYGCDSIVGLQGPSAGILLFQDGSRLFDASIAELRLSGSGELASAEAEDVDLVGLAEQVTVDQAAVPAELNQTFAESSTDLINASTSIAESAPEMFPFGKGEQAEIADDYALLKVVKATTILASAAMSTPMPLRKVTAAEKMIKSAELVHQSIVGGAESELIESTGELLAHSEEYVGSAEAYSAEESFVLAVHNYGDAAQLFAQEQHLPGGKSLLTSADNITLSTSYFGSGVDSLNAEAEFFGSAELAEAAEMIPFSEHLVAEANIFQMHAQGESAEMGAAEMIVAANQILTNAETDASNIGAGGDKLDTGSDQFIAGTITYKAAEAYNINANRYYRAAENLYRSYWIADAEKGIMISSELLHPSSELFHAGAEALQSIELTQGVESLVPAAGELLEGAEFLQSIAENAEAEIGAEQMVQGAAEALEGAEMADAGGLASAESSEKLLERGAESVELGTYGLMNGAAEFIQGYN